MEQGKEDADFLRILAADMERWKHETLDVQRLRAIADKLETLEKGYRVIKEGEETDGMASR